MPLASIDAIKALIGKDAGTSSWLLLDQAKINQFADATGDHQFIHVDPEMARNTPFGGTIAHGFLTLSVLPVLKTEAVPLPEGLKMAVNYGFNRIRFLSPVRSGKRIRAHFKMLDFSEKRPGQWQETVEVTVEIEGEEKPALTAEWIALYFV